jgi:hypothetical protein
MLVDIPQTLGRPDTMPQWTWRDSEEQEAKAVRDYRNLAPLCAEAKEVLQNFNEYVQQCEEWKGVILKFAVLAQRKIRSLPWSLFYWVNHIDRMREYDFGHWHDEPAWAEDGNLSSCKPVPELLENHLCRKCDTQRLLEANDGFWLADNNEGFKGSTEPASGYYDNESEKEVHYPGENDEDCESS